MVYALFQPHRLWVKETAQLHFKGLGHISTVKREAHPLI